MTYALVIALYLSCPAVRKDGGCGGEGGSIKRKRERERGRGRERERERERRGGNAQALQ